MDKQKKAIWKQQKQKNGTQKQKLKKRKLPPIKSSKGKNRKKGNKKKSKEGSKNKVGKDMIISKRKEAIWVPWTGVYVCLLPGRNLILNYFANQTTLDKRKCRILGFKQLFSIDYFLKWTKSAKKLNYEAFKPEN